MTKKVAGGKVFKKRDFSFLAAAHREISLSTRADRDRTKYSRKIKHKNKIYA